MFDLQLMILLILDQLTDWFGNILKIVRNVTMTQSDVIISFEEAMELTDSFFVCLA